MKALVATVAGTVGLIFGVAISLTVGGALLATSSPLVREHCVTSSSEHVQTSWKPVIWPPYFTATDVVTADKLCIRNSPTREILSAVRIWKLGTPEEQFKVMLANAQD